MKRSLLTLAISLALTTPALAADQPGNNRQPATGQDQARGQRPHKRSVRRVDLVIALDTSGSMQGLINAARQKLWDIVNEIARAKPTPVLRVGLVTYGSQGSEQDGYVRVRSDLTTNLDAIYGKLFELSTSGGTEYVGRAVHRATRELSWDRSRRTLKQIFIAGNESADQDRAVRSSLAARAARKRGIFVNAIYCGAKRSGDVPSWRAVATSGGGIFASIDHNRGTVNIATPYDAKLKALSARLNRTYVGYGARGRARSAMQAKQDRNAASVHSSVAASRAKAKASAVYRNDDWDLVDARKGGKLGEIRRRGALPAKLRKLSKKQLKGYLDQLERERKQLRQRINAVSSKRRAYVAGEMKKRGTRTDQAFDEALKRGIRVQAKKMGFRM